MDDQLAVGSVVHLEQVIDHSRCHAGTCVTRVLCPKCGAKTWVNLVQGRWDYDRAATKLPFEPVWVSLNCGCSFGDQSLAKP